MNCCTHKIQTHRYSAHTWACYRVYCSFTVAKSATTGGWQSCRALLRATSSSHIHSGGIRAAMCHLSQRQLQNVDIEMLWQGRRREGWQWLAVYLLDVDINHNASGIIFQLLWQYFKSVSLSLSLCPHLTSLSNLFILKPLLSLLSSILLASSEPWLSFFFAVFPSAPFLLCCWLALYLAVLLLLCLWPFLFYRQHKYSFFSPQVFGSFIMLLLSFHIIRSECRDNWVASTAHTNRHSHTHTLTTHTDIFTT